MMVMGALSVPALLAMMAQTAKVKLMNVCQTLARMKEHVL